MTYVQPQPHATATQASLQASFWQRMLHHGPVAAKASTSSRYPSVQRHFLTLRSVQDDVLCLTSTKTTADHTAASQRDNRKRRPGRGSQTAGDAPLYRAVIEVRSLNFGLKGAGEQEAILSGYAAFLNSLGSPVQLLTRVLPLDLEPYLMRMRAAGVTASPAVQTLIEDHLRYVCALASGRALLERRFYLVIPAEQAPGGILGSHDSHDSMSQTGALLDGETPVGAGGSGSPFHVLRTLLPLARRAQHAGERQRAYALVQQRLALRADEVLRQLARFGVEGRRLRTDELLTLYVECLTPSHSVSGRMSAARNATNAAPAPSHSASSALWPPLAVHGSLPLAGHAPLLIADGGNGGSGVIADAYPDSNACGKSASSGKSGESGESEKIRDNDSGDEEDTAQIRQGVDTLLDRLAPAAVEMTRDALHIDTLWVRTLAVTGYPRSVLPGWLALLIDLDEPFELSLHIRPLSSRAMIRQLTSRMVALHSSRLLDERHGRLPDPEREVAYSDMERLRDALQRGDERVFTLALYLLVRAPTRKALAERCARLHATLDHLQLQCRPATLEHDLGFTSCLPEARDRLGRVRTFDTSGLATAFPFTASGLSMREGILYGVQPDTGSLVILEPFAPELENANQVVFAKSGAGKSYACKLQVLRALLLGTRVCVVDPEDEYRRLASAVGGQVIRLAPGSRQRINPFDLPQPAGPGAASEISETERIGGAGGDALADKVQVLHALLDLLLADRTPTGAVGLSQREKGLLDRCLYETYRRVGITSDPRTHDRSAPLLRDLYDTLCSGVCGVDSFGLAERLERYAHGSLAALFSSPTNVALDAPLVVFDVRDLDGELRPLGLLLIADYVWTRVRLARQPHLLVIDEAWSLMQHTEGGRFLAGLARRARKHYLGLITITQDVEDFLGSEWGRVVLANSSIQLLMKQDSTTIDAVSDAFHLSTGERHYLLACHKGEGLLFARGGHVQLRVEASEREHALITTDPRELAQRMAERARIGATEPPAAKEAGDMSNIAHHHTSGGRDGALVSDVSDLDPDDEDDEDDTRERQDRGLQDRGLTESGVAHDLDLEAQGQFTRLRVIARAGHAVAEDQEEGQEGGQEATALPDALVWPDEASDEDYAGERNSDARAPSRDDAHHTGRKERDDDTP